MTDTDYLTDGKLHKMDVDYSSTVDLKVPEAQRIAKDGRIDEALESLLSLEKQTRTGADAVSTGRILVAIVQICYQQSRFDLLIDNIINLTKKRGQLKQAVTKMVQECCNYVDSTADMEKKLKLIETLRTITAGKIYVENERARLSLILSKIRESEGNITEASSVLQELQVETYGTMEKKEKVEFILEQMRLCLAKNDYVRTQIVSKKISIKYFEEKDTHEQKLKFYQLMIELDQHEGSYLSICKHYMAIYNTPVIKEDIQKCNEALTCVVAYLILAQFDNEQSDLIHRIQQDPKLQELNFIKDLLKHFTTSEIMSWKYLCEKYGTNLRNTTPTQKIFDSNTEQGQKHWTDLKSRTVEHNIRVMAKYYTRIHLKRMSQLLDLTLSETEEFLSNLVVNKTVQTRIDRLEGIVSFQGVKDPSDILNDWSYNINSLMKLVNKTTHLITKEEMIHKFY